jgi:hypothetical protein
MNLTRKQVWKAVTKFTGYIAVRYDDGDVVGMNCSVAKLSSKRFPMDDQKTRIIGFYPIDFHEYIRIKTPFK